MAHDVFISHSSRNKTVADAICANLEKTHIRCWVAPRDIRPGAAWAEAIAEGIKDGRVFVLVFSRESNHSEDVFREISMAAGRGIPIVAFRIHDVEPTGRMEYYLKPMHWLDAVDPPLLARIGELTETVQLLLETSRRISPPVQARAVRPAPVSTAEVPLAPGETEAEAKVQAKAQAEAQSEAEAITHAKTPRLRGQGWSVRPRRRRLVLLASVVGPIAVAAIVAVTVLVWTADGSTRTAEPTTILASMAQPTTTLPSTTTTLLLAGTWTDLDPSGRAPSHREGHAMAYDTDSGKVFLFGGNDPGHGPGGRKNDLWAYDPSANTWTELHPDGPEPSRRCYLAMVYDSVSRKVILFGGAGLGDRAEWTDADINNDTWAYDPVANTWTELDPVGPVPEARAGHAMVYDQDTGLVYLFGGGGRTQDYDDTWAYDPVANTWTELHPSGGAVPAQMDHAMVCDPVGHKVLLFGLSWASLGLGTYIYDPAANSWTGLSSVSAGVVPPHRVGHAIVYDPVIRRVLLFAGQLDPASFDDFWAFDPADNTWTELHPSGAPPARSSFAMVWDSVNDQAILFGGWDDSGGLLNDTWSYVDAQ